MTRNFLEGFERTLDEMLAPSALSNSYRPKPFQHRPVAVLLVPVVDAIKIWVEAKLKESNRGSMIWKRKLGYLEDARKKSSLPLDRRSFASLLDVGVLVFPRLCRRKRTARPLCSRFLLELPLTVANNRPFRGKESLAIFLKPLNRPCSPLRAPKCPP